MHFDKGIELASKHKENIPNQRMFMEQVLEFKRTTLI